jgi:hypothetical protein
LLRLRDVYHGSRILIFVHAGSNNIIKEEGEIFWVLLFLKPRHKFLLSCQWIRIRNPDPDPGGQKLHTKVEFFFKVHVLKCYMASFES